MASKDVRHPQAGGGTFEYFRLAARLNRLGHDVSVLCGGFAGSNTKELVDGISVSRVGGAWSVYILSLFSFLLDADLRRQDVVVNVEENGIPFSAPYLLRMQSVIICWHLPRETFFVELMDQFGTIVGFAIASLLCFYEDVVGPMMYRLIPVFTFSNCSALDLLTVGFKNVSNHEFALSKGIMLLSATDSEIPIERRVSHTSSSDYPRLIIVGRLTKYKGVQDVLRSLPRLIPTFPRLKLSIVGRGDYEGALRQIVNDLNLRSHVDFAGFVSVKDKMELYSKSQLNIVPSYKEGFPTPLIEAALVGVPSLVPARIGLQEFVKDGETGFTYQCEGFLNPRPDFVALADQIASLLSDERRLKAAGSRAREWYSGLDISGTEEEFTSEFLATIRSRARR